SAVEGGATKLTYTFTRTGDTSTALPINFTIAGTAALADDYTASSPDAGFTFAGVNGTVTLAAGSATATVVLTPLDDTLVEGDETVQLTVAAGASYGIGTPSSATGTITDADSATVSFQSASSSAGEDGGQVGLTVRLTTAAGNTLAADAVFS